MSQLISVPQAPHGAAVRSLAPWVGACMLGALGATAWAQTALVPVIVSATRFSAAADDLPLGVSVLTADAIRACGATTVNDAIMKLLGIPGRLDFYGGGDYGLDLRGFSTTADSNQVVIVDGIRINEADLSGTRLAGIPIDSVERIEVLRGSAAVLYGEGATAGAIVITTRAGRGADRKSQVDAYMAAGNFGTRELRGTGSLVAGDFSINASANQRDSDNDRDNFRSRTDGAAVTVQWSNDWLRAGGRHAYDHLAAGLPGSLTAAQYEADPHQASTPLDSAGIRNNRSGVFAEAKLGHWQVDLDAGWRGKALNSNYVGAGYVYAYEVDARTYALRARHTVGLGAGANDFVAGVDRAEWKRSVLGSFGSESSQRSQAAYLRDEVTLPSSTRLSAGWRIESVRADSTAATSNIDERPLAWELSVLQPLGGVVSAYGRYGRSFRLANADEFGFTTPGVRLQAQTSRDVELGVRWGRVGGRVELRAYRSALTNEIGYDPNAVGPSSAFGFNGANVNFDKTLREGLELEITQAIAAGASLHINAATRRARFATGSYQGNDVPLTPRQTLSVRADWSHAAGHRVDGGVNLVSSQSPDFANACRMPSYATADVRYAYRWRTAEFAMGSSNLANAKYYTQAVACLNGAVSSIYPESGRALTASVRLQF